MSFDRQNELVRNTILHIEGLASKGRVLHDSDYFGGVRHGGPGMVRLSNPAGSPLGPAKLATISR